MYAGRATHPVFVALMPTVRKHGIPRQPFADLVQAFVQDQTVTRYRTWDELFGYCRYSANPVGRLVLYLCGYSDAGAAAPLRLRRARRCNSRISGRTSRWTCSRIASTSRSM